MYIRLYKKSVWVVAISRAERACLCNVWRTSKTQIRDNKGHLERLHCPVQLVHVLFLGEDLQLYLWRHWLVRFFVFDRP